MADFRQRNHKEALSFELFLCKRQPGNLLITKEACARQYQYGRARLSKGGRGKFHHPAQPSLEICGQCAKGHGYFQELPNDLKASGSRRISKKGASLKKMKTAE